MVPEESRDGAKLVGVCGIFTKERAGNMLSPAGIERRHVALGQWQDRQYADIDIYPGRR